MGYALLHYKEARRQRPKWPMVLNNLAGILATSPDDEIRNGAEALQWAGYANQITGGMSAIILDTLAAAYAENGRFSEAIKVAKRAQSITREAGHAEIAQRIPAGLH